MVKRCRHCNGWLKYRGHDLDPKKELCDECFIKLDEVKEFDMILELGISIKYTSPSEIINYLRSVCEYTLDIDVYDIKFKLPEGKEDGKKEQ